MIHIMHLAEFLALNMHSEVLAIIVGKFIHISFITPTVIYFTKVREFSDLSSW